MKRVILLEFNELAPHLLDKWMGQNKLPNFKKFYDHSQVYVTKPDVDDPNLLEPWIQWYSMHVGMGYDEHKVFHLTDGSKTDDLDIWQHLINNGKKVSSFASMNTKSFKGEGNLYLPDPWCTSEPAFPSELNVYQKFITDNVQEHTNESKRNPLAEYADFIQYMVKNGLSLPTIFKLIKQLVVEKTVDKESYWKRVFLLDRIQMDLFKSYYKNNDFDFTTFFLNSTAHLQHAYWRFMEPDAFDVQPNEEELKIYGDAIFLSYTKMDEIIGQMIELVDDNTMIVLASALSQKPYVKKESMGGQNFYRPHDVEGMLKDMDIRPEEIQPTMTHQYMLRFKDKIASDLARQKLLSWSYGDNKPIFSINNRAEENCIYFCNEISEKVAPDLIIKDHYNSRQVKYSQYFYRISETKSGCHHPDGVLWFRTGEHQVINEKASILDVFPTIMNCMDVPLPQHLIGKGHSINI